MTRFALSPCFAVLLLAALPVPVMAGDTPAPEAAAAPFASGAASPLEISADQGLTWDRAGRRYIAQGRAEVRQGDMRVTADKLTAEYADDGGATDVRRVVAEGNVTLAQPPYTAFGDRAEYDVAAGRAVMTGTGLRIETPGETLTARDRLTYHAADGRMTAEGDALLKRAADSLAAARMDATFATGADGARALDAITAEGGVTIRTPRETITGSRGVYRARTQQAELTGDVTIAQDKNRLEGRRATVDMRTGVSTLYGAGGGDGRVRGVFYPKSSSAAGPAPAAAGLAEAPAPAPEKEDAAPAVTTPAPAEVAAPASPPPIEASLPAPPVATAPAPEPEAAAETPVPAAAAPEAPPAAEEETSAPAAVETPAEDLVAEPFAVPSATHTPASEAAP
jgi:lipopolysaccharide export system protein LptA